jgi:tetratricopeptide (TPR) repeat protein
MFSYVAMDRMLENEMASNAELREKAAGRPIRSLAKPLTDEELVAKLRSFGIDLDRASLGALCNESLSAEEIARPLTEKCVFRTREEELQGDWIWVCVDALWQRWYPDKPSFEMLDDKMQAGYELNSSGKVEDGARIWLEAWNDILYFCDKADLRSISEFDERFAGTQSLFNWIGDLEIELWNAGIEDRQFLRARIAVCEETLCRFAAEDELLRENFQRSLADSYFALGDTGKADELYRKWLDADPQWGWGWIGWSDCYWFTRTESKNPQKAEALLREGLSFTGVRDRKDLVDRLADLYEEQGRDQEAREIRQLAETPSPEVEQTIEVMPGINVVQLKTGVAFGEEGLPLSEIAKLANLFAHPAAPVTGSREKIGRNDPCPCGSGKKFKKCCAESRQPG